MPTSYSPDALSAAEKTSVIREVDIEDAFIATLQGLKYEYRRDITDRASLEANFREKFEALNRVKLTDAEFALLLDEIITPDVFAASKTLRAINAFTRDDGTPLNYTLVNIKDWCKNTFEVINQLRINHDNSHHRYDVLILINGVPCVQIELKTLGVNPRRAILPSSFILQTFSNARHFILNAEPFRRVRSNSLPPPTRVLNAA